ncbi:MAG TPA: cell wall hydrolase [Allosphingosinicella sp.]|nr:cell wall hydrolase [Allosphingosinicella sp.]
MFRFARAAAYAVASFIVAASATYAGPSLAWNADTAAGIAPPYDHGAVGPVQDQSLAIADPLASPPTYDPNLTVDVAQHAVAAIEEEEVEQEENRTLGQLVAAYASADVGDSEMNCLASAVYFESKGEPLQGQLAVAEVILNRAASGKYPPSICGVVKQKSQFSFVRGGRIPAIPRASEAWRKAVAIAHIAVRDLADGGVKNALFFHARYVSPSWRNRPRVASIGNHIFYR